MRYKFLFFAFAASVLLATAASAQQRLFLPQVADGRFAPGAFRTTLILTNNTNQTAATVLRLTDDAGRPLPMALAGLGTNSIFNLSLPPGASRFLQTEGAGGLTSGAAEITSDASIGAAAIVSVLNAEGQFQSEVGIAAAPALAEFTFPVESSIFFDTGLALFNPADTSVVMALELLDEEGRGVTSTQIALPPRGHIARFTSELFALRPNLRGSVSVAAGGNVAAVALRQNRVRLSYTSLPVAAGIARRPPSDAAPLLRTTRTGIDATSDIVVNETLAEGLRLSGAILGPGVPRFISARTADRTFSGAVDPATRTYSIAVPPGTYVLSVGFEPFHGPYWSAFERVRVSADAGTVQVAADTIRDITLPETGQPFQISGRILGLEALPGARNTVVSFASEDSRIQASFELNGEGAYSGVLPSGRYRVSLERVTVAPPLESLGFLNLGSLNVNEAPATGDYSIPLLAQLSGAVRIGGGPAPEGAIVSAVATAPFSELTSYGFTSADSAGAYQVLLANNRSYAVHVGVPLGAGGFLSYASPLPVMLAGPAVLDVDVPALPRTVAVSGKVTDSQGRPAAHTFVSASSRSIGGAGGVTFSASAVTDAAGNYSLMLLSGAGYTVTFTPAP
jgi:hypothetical protein